MATKGELAAANFALEQIRQHAGADSLKYLSFEGMIVATGLPKNMLCTACFDGDYPVAPPIEV
jgi:amidophosphoribosyltransferase